jgi:Fe-S cluster biogenesis protein NfuA
MAKLTSQDLETRVEQTLDEIRPYLMSHGGDVTLLEVTAENVARLQLLGACGGCPMSAMTLKFGIERLLADRVPELAGIEAVTADDLEWSEDDE